MDHFGKSISHEKFGVWVKLKKRHAKNDSTRTMELFCAKNRSKNTKYSRNETILKMDYSGKSISHEK